MIYVSVFIYFNFKFLVFWVGPQMSETLMSSMSFSNIWGVLPHAPPGVFTVPLSPQPGNLVEH